MFKAGYQPAVRKSSPLRRLVENLDALHSLQIEILQQIDTVEDISVTEAELTRDFGFSTCSIKVLRRFGLLKETQGARSRAAINVRNVLRTRVLLPVFL